MNAGGLNMLMPVEATAVFGVIFGPKMFTSGCLGVGVGVEDVVDMFSMAMSVYVELVGFALVYKTISWFTCLI